MALYPVVDGTDIFAADLNQYYALVRGAQVRDVVAGYGAVHDGTTDDQPAIAAAIAAAADGDTILFPPGVYAMASVIGQTTKSLHFIGYGATLKFTGASFTQYWALDLGDGTVQLNNVSIRGLSFDCNVKGRTPVQLGKIKHLFISDLKFTGYTYTGVTTTDSALRLDNCKRVNIHDVIIHDWLYGNTGGTSLHRGITLENGSGLNEDVVIRGLQMDTADQGIVLQGNRITISDCHFDNMSDNPIYAIESTTGLIIKGNVFEGVDEGIVLANHVGAGGTIKGVVIEGNRFVEITNKGIAVQGTLSDVVVKGNTFENITTNSTHISRRPLFDDVLVDWVITGNTFTGIVNFAAVYFTQVNGMIFSDNRMHMTFPTVNTFFLRVDTGGSNDLLIAHNAFSSVGGANAGHIRLLGTNTRVKVADNLLSPGDVIEPFAVAMRGQLFTGGNWQDSTQKVGWSAAAPASGAFLVGDVVYNTAPVSGGFIGWVCTTAGSPGTWKTFGVIS